MHNLGCPDCNKPNLPPQECVLNKPMLLYIPPGPGIHIPCPAHPEGHHLHGSSYTC